MVPLSLLLIFLPFILLFLEGKKARHFFSELLLTRKKPLFQLASGIKLFGFLAIVFFFEGIIFHFLGILDSQKVVDAIYSQSWVMLVIAFTLAPIAEELFFRGYLQARIGVVFASIIFALLHLGYGSVAEVIAAFTMSMIVGWWVRRQKQLAPAIIAHALYNLFSITMTLYVLKAVI